MFLARVKERSWQQQSIRRWVGAGFWWRDGLKPTEPAAAEPNVVVDWLGAARGSTVMVSTDGDIARERFGNNTPARMVVVGIVDAVQEPVTRGEGASASEQRGAKRSAA